MLIKCKWKFSKYNYINSFIATENSCCFPHSVLDISTCWQTTTVDLSCPLALYSMCLWLAWVGKIKWKLLAHHMIPLCVSTSFAADTLTCFAYFLRHVWPVSPNRRKHEQKHATICLTGGRFDTKFMKWFWK